ncbi:tetratricopeptide repeat protein [Clavibacter zhangzhiyongii]|uniref:Tetratricopeptide repeat protein n=1 Tax=Clavibacter zhangzhiyongii TaxID=2768071 RepID=A0A7L7Z218_9MICO|nr:tetratricopeptide repeat protein [Clavibacter zhangzhiyongii]QOD43705.1 tetratricopeptide repeat protein [Clavibacter zhangzhiyongii]
MTPGSFSIPPFVGASRLAYVSDLLSSFNRLGSEGTGQWIHLDAPSGAGKTRIVQQFYKEIASKHQQTSAYWPPLITEDSTELTEDQHARARKATFPMFPHVPGSLPQFMWWGITATTLTASRGNSAHQAFHQWLAHAPYIAELVRQNTSRLDRLKTTISGSTDALVDEIGNLALSGATGAMGIDLGLGTGLAYAALKQIATSSERVEERKRLVRGSDDIREDMSVVHDRIYDVLMRSIGPKLPTVIFIEDAHWGDSNLLNLMTKLVESNPYVMVISTAWPEQASDSALESALREAKAINLFDQNQEVARVSANLALEEDARYAILRHYFPNVESSTAKAIVKLYSNPLELTLFGLWRRYHEQFPSGDLKLSSEAIEELPSTVAGLYRGLWQELDNGHKRMFSLLAHVTKGVDEGLIQGAKAWIANDISAAFGAVDFQIDFDESESGVEALLLQAPTWISSLGSGVYVFSSSAQAQVAEEDNQFFSKSQHAGFRDALLKLTIEAVHNGLYRNPAQASAASQFVIAMYEAGLVEDREAVLEAGAIWVDYLDRSPGNSARKINVASSLTSEIDSDSLAYWVLTFYRAQALQEKGSYAESASAFEAIMNTADIQEKLGEAFWYRLLSAYAQTLMKGRRLQEAKDIFAFLASTGDDNFVNWTNYAAVLQAEDKYQDAADVLEELLETALEEDVPNEYHIFALRANLGPVYAKLMRTDEAIASLQAAIAMDSEALDRRARQQLPVVRNSLAGAMQAHKLHAEALALFEQLANQFAEEWGPDHPNTLLAESNAATALFDLKRFAESMALLDSLLPRIRNILTEDSREFMVAYHYQARCLDELGDSEAAAVMHERNLAHRTDVLGQFHIETLISGHYAGVAYRNAGQPYKAIKQFAATLRDRAVSLGSCHFETENTRHELTTLYVSEGMPGPALKYAQQTLDCRVAKMEPEVRNLYTSRLEDLEDMRRSSRKSDALIATCELLLELGPK